MKRLLAALAATASIGATTLPSQAKMVEAGFIVCQVAGGDGFVFGSTKSVECTYTPGDSSRQPERYSGQISRFGVDLGFTGDGLLKWAVLAKTHDAYDGGALAGRYVGAGSEVTAGLGLGSNILVSTTTDKWVLQPVSISGQTGLNIAFGITGFELVTATK